MQTLSFRDVTDFSSLGYDTYNSYVVLAMLPSASNSVARSRHMQHDHTSSRFRNKSDIILTQEGLGGGAPHRGRESSIQSKYVRSCRTIHSQRKPYCNCREGCVISLLRSVISKTERLHKKWYS